jgi:D-glycero-D-manno-heptose 1,7-bisphosphate phosphatase
MGSDPLTRSANNRAVFLDRDGVLNHNWLNPTTGEWESPIRPEDFRLCAGIVGALAELTAHGFRLILVSNQSSAAKGKCSLADLQSVHARFMAELKPGGIVFDEFCYDYAHPQAVVPELSGPLTSRKPSAYFLERAIRSLGLDRSCSWMVGDRDTDIECGRRAGVRTIQVASPDPDARALVNGHADFDAENLEAAVNIIVAETRRHQSEAKPTIAESRSSPRCDDASLAPSCDLQRSPRASSPSFGPFKEDL